MDFNVEPANYGDRAKTLFHCTAVKLPSSCFHPVKSDQKLMDFKVEAANYGDRTQAHFHCTAVSCLKREILTLRRLITAMVLKRTFTIQYVVRLPVSCSITLILNIRNKYIEEILTPRRPVAAFRLRRTTVRRSNQTKQSKLKIYNSFWTCFKNKLKSLFWRFSLHNAE